MADELIKKPYTVVQGDAEGNIWIENVLCKVGDTVYLTWGEAEYRIGNAIEPFSNSADLPNPTGEHKVISGLMADEETRNFNPIEAKDDLPALRPTRSIPAPDVAAAIKKPAK